MIAFVTVAWLSILALFLGAPVVFLQALRLPPSSDGAIGLAALGGISLIVAFFGFGVALQWRWLFWLILVAFLAGITRLISSGLEIAGVLPSQTPTWYAMYQATLGVVQFAIGLLMLRGYRRSGVWGAF